jgi:membrane protease YdiL (CAAX protease family)
METALPSLPRQSETPGRSLATDVGAYIALAFAFSWIMTIGAIKLGFAEEYLNIGTAGPALAALLLSRHRQPAPVRPSGSRWLWLGVLLAPSWIVLSAHSLWWHDMAAPVHVNPWLLLPALVPAWILSGVFSGKEGERCLVRRLVHAPDRWSMYALLYFPVLLGIPSVIAHALGARLIWPSLGGFTMAAVGSAAIFFLYNLLFVATEEEPGWRGFLLDRLQRNFSPLSATLLTWLPWALWHAPVDYYRPTRFTWVQEILLRVVFLIPLSIVLTWFYNRSGRSIQATAIFHASMNTFRYVVPYYQPAWFALFIFAAYAVIADRMWSRASRAAGWGVARETISQ